MSRAMAPELVRVRASIDQLGWFDDGERRYFAQQSPRYDYVLRFLRAQPRPARLLDIGSHVLHFGMAASQLGFDVWGCDVEHFARPPLNAARQQRYGIAEVRPCDLACDPLPYDDASFEIVNFTEILEHLNFNPLPVLKEIYRVLVPGGMVMISTPNMARLGARLRALAGRNPFPSLEMLCNGSSYALHWREYTMAEVATLLGWSNFDVTKRAYFYGYPQPFARRLVQAAIQRVLPSLSGALFVVGQKRRPN